jgi:O-antigen/teichoic acid export membrane protein
MTIQSHRAPLYGQTRVRRKRYPGRHAKPRGRANRHHRHVAGRGHQNLVSEVRSGTLWSILNTVVLRVSSFGVTVLLARTVFGPRAFGLYAVSQVVLNLLLSANEMGVSLAIVRWKGDVRIFARTVCTLTIASSSFLYCALFAIAPEFARMLGSPGATGMVRIMCLCVIIDGIVCVPLALLTRTFAQRSLFLIELLNFLVTTGVTFWLAFSGMGPISFAWGSVAGCSVALISATIAAPFVVLPGWNTRQARKLLRFGLPLAGASLLLLGVYNVDSIIVGATLGPTALGLYSLAFNMSSWTVRATSEAVRRVSFAGFSRLADSADSLANGYSRTIGMVLAVAVPSAVLLGTLAEPLILEVYGPRWTPAAHALTLLAVLGLLRVVYEITYDCLAASGKRTMLLGIQALWLTTLFPVLVLGAHLRGIAGVAGGHVLIAGLLVGPLFIWGLSRCGIQLRHVFSACLRPFIGGILMVAACELALHEIGHNIVGAEAAAAAGAIVYISVIFPMRSLLRAKPDESMI